MSRGPWQARALSTGRFKLDGGAMFGNVPRVLWEREYPADAQHRVVLELRVLLLEGDGRTVVVDTGSGNLWSEKEQGMFDVDAERVPGIVGALREAGVEPEAVTDVVLTHLHFDHAGGVTRRGDDDAPTLTFPNATHHVQLKNLENANNHPVGEPMLVVVSFFGLDCTNRLQSWIHNSIDGEAKFHSVENHGE